MTFTGDKSSWSIVYHGNTIGSVIFGGLQLGTFSHKVSPSSSKVRSFSSTRASTSCAPWVEERDRNVDVRYLRYELVIGQRVGHDHINGGGLGVVRELEQEVISFPHGTAEAFTR
uniref:(northern house mosquito) hypothetical protein n=1 Tax=Culex pipiens TaxID=7175 RepID=A0A8D8IK42_CULPI